MKDIFLSGIQGAGKGTQAALIKKEYPELFKYFETGAVLRALSSTDNAIGNYIKESVATGKLVKDEVTVGIVNVFLETVEKTDHLLFDGTLRKLGQTQAVCKKLHEIGRDFVVLHFDLPDEVVYERLATRVVCSKCGENAFNGVIGGKCGKCGGELIRRQDDSNIEAIKNRIDGFYSDTMPALKWVEEQGRLVHIDANRSVNEVFEDIKKYIE